MCEDMMIQERYAQINLMRAVRDVMIERKEAESCEEKDKF